MKPSWCEALLLAGCALLCGIQLLLPGYIGIANNGDFGKVHARFDLDPPDDGQRNFIYFVPDYEFDPRHHWASDVLSSEILLAAGPILLVKAAGSAAFNIRWLGALHASLFVAAYAALLFYLRRFGPARQMVLGILALWIFGDVAYVAYFNSFYSDTAAILGFLLMVPLALHLAAAPGPRRTTLWLFAAAAALFISSKTQHGIYGFVPAVYALAAVWRWQRVRTTGLAVCAVLLSVEAAAILTTSADYRAHPLFNVIFYKIAPASPAPAAALAELGLGEADLQYVGQHAYTPGSPILDRTWLADFMHRTGAGRVAAYCLRHPRRALAAMRADLTVNAPLIRPPNLSNFLQSDGHPPGARTNRFSAWSTLRSWLFLLWPEHIVAWYLLVLGYCAAIIIRRPSSRPAASVCLVVALAAVLEFTVASLTDALETYRHLLLFHLMTDVTIYFAAALALCGLGGPAPRDNPGRKAQNSIEL